MGTRKKKIQGRKSGRGGRSLLSFRVVRISLRSSPRSLFSFASSSPRQVSALFSRSCRASHPPSVTRLSAWTRSPRRPLSRRVDTKERVEEEAVESERRKRKTFSIVWNLSRAFVSSSSLLSLSRRRLASLFALATNARSPATAGHTRRREKQRATLDGRALHPTKDDQSSPSKSTNREKCPPPGPRSCPRASRTSPGAS